MARRRNKKGQFVGGGKRTRRRTVKRNPSNPRRSYRRAGGAIRGLNMKTALKSIPGTQLGMLAAMFGARVGGDYGTFQGVSRDWKWDNYLKAMAAGGVAGFFANMLKPGMGQHVLNGAINLVAFNVIQTELVGRSETLATVLGQDYPELEFDEAGRPYMLGSNGQWMPADESYRMLGDVIMDPGPLGDELMPADHLGAEPVSRLDDKYREAIYGGVGDGGPGDPFASAFHG